AGPPSVAEDLLQRLALRKLVHELVEVTDLLHERVLDGLHADAADDAGDERRVWIQPRLAEEVRDRRAGPKVPLQLGLVIACQPPDHGIELVAGAALFLELREVERIDRGYRRREDPVSRRRAHPSITANQRPSGSENAKLGVPPCSPTSVAV